MSMWQGAWGGGGEIYYVTHRLECYPDNIPEQQLTSPYTKMTDSIAQVFWSSGSKIRSINFVIRYYTFLALGLEDIIHQYKRGRSLIFYKVVLFPEYFSPYASSSV